MKKFLVVMACLMCAGLLLAFSAPQTHNSQYLRIHIRANSNLDIDQSVKFQVKDKVVEYMTPLLADCKTKEQSVQTISAHLNEIQNIATKTLQQNGFCYSATAQIKNEEFPARSYGDLTLDGGFYDALILNLGTGAGNNWWCVVYPPLCFVNGGASANVFKSRILEIINNFFSK